MGKRPKADFSENCSAAPRDYDGIFMQDAACAGPEAQDYKEGIVAALAGFPEMLERLRAGGRQGAFAFTLAPLAAAAGALSAVQKAQAVNHAVNSMIAYKTDLEAHGVADYWQTPEETLRRGTGDCEDFALLKMALLEGLGLPKEKMWIATGILRDPAKAPGRNEAHATLVVELEGRPHVLDNAYRARAGMDEPLATLGEFTHQAYFMPVTFMNEREYLARTEQQLRSDVDSLQQEQRRNGVAAPPRRPDPGTTPH